MINFILSILEKEEMLAIVFASQSYCQKQTQLKIREIYHFIVLECYILKSRCLWGKMLLWDSELKHRHVFLLISCVCSQFLVSLDFWKHSSNSCLPFQMTFPKHIYFCIQNFLPVQAPGIELEPTLIHLNSITTTVYFQIRSCSLVPENWDLNIAINP